MLKVLHAQLMEENHLHWPICKSVSDVPLVKF